MISTLADSSIVPDPYQGGNEEECRWIASEDWVAETVFVLENSDEIRNWHLSLDRVDTVAEIMLNGLEIGRTAMHSVDTGGWYPDCSKMGKTHCLFFPFTTKGGSS